MLTPIDAYFGQWSPLARLQDSAIRGYWDELAGSRADVYWNDRRGAGPDLVPGSGAMTFGSRKGRETAIFDGSTWIEVAFANAQPLAIVVAVKFTSAIPPPVLIDGVGATATVQLSGLSEITINAGTALAATFSSSLKDRWVVVGAIFNGANSSIYENGILRASGDAGANNPTGLRLGADNSGTQAFTGEVAELHCMDPTTLHPHHMTVDSWYQMRKWV